MNGLKRSRLLEILESFKGLRIMVVGDFALDAYWYVDMTNSELSRETPHYTRPVIRENYFAGASGNICCNVKALGVNEAFAVTILGKDWRGEILKEKLQEKEVIVDHVIASPERVTSTYVKPILCGWDSQQEDSRVDFINHDVVSATLENRLIQNVQSVVPEMDAVIVEDQILQNGLITDKIRDSLIRTAEENDKKVFVADSRKQIDLFRSMVLKPNRIEAIEAVCPSKNPSGVEMGELIEIGQKMWKECRRPVYVTLSEKGVLLITESGHYNLPSAPIKPPIDAVGAGDAFIATITAGLAGGASPVEAGVLANLAASVTTKKLNTTGTASPKEILEKFDEVAEADEWP